MDKLDQMLKNQAVILWALGKLLQEAGSDDNSPLHTMCSHCFEETVKMLDEKTRNELRRI